MRPFRRHEVTVHRWVYTCQHVLCRKVKIFTVIRYEVLFFIVFTILKPHPNVTRLCGTGVHRCPSVSINAADIGLAYLTGIVMVLPAFRSDS